MTSLSFSLSCIGEGNGNPLQCSCLENPRDGGAWWAAFYGIAQSRTQLKRLSSSSRYFQIRYHACECVCLLGQEHPCWMWYLSMIGPVGYFAEQQGASHRALSCAPVSLLITDSFPFQGQEERGRVPLSKGSQGRQTQITPGTK